MRLPLFPPTFGLTPFRLQVPVPDLSFQAGSVPSVTSDRVVERETRLELATSTLARLRSTN